MLFCATIKGRYNKLVPTSSPLGILAMANVTDAGGPTDEPVALRSVGIASITQGIPDEGCYRVIFSAITDTTQVAIVGIDAGSDAYLLCASGQSGNEVTLNRRDSKTGELVRGNLQFIAVG